MNRTHKKAATEIVQRLQDAGHDAFWVGGCVRDLLLGREPEDYDIATSASPEEVEAVFQRTVAVGRKFGVMIVLARRRSFQVATFRAEADYQDGRHPGQVEFGNALADARRRDFTVNGLFYDPVKATLRDWVGGEADLKAGVIRTIGEPAERFAEDHLRLLRAVRFAARLGFEIERKTFEALRSHAAGITRISAERVRDELNKLFGPGPAVRVARPELACAAARGLELLHQSGLLALVLPEVAATVACEQSPDFHPEGDVFNHLKRMLEQMPPDADPLLPWAVLMHDIAKPVTASRDERSGAIHFYEHEKVGEAMAVKILERLKFPRKQIDIIAQAVRCHMQFKDAPQMRKSTLRRMLLRPTFPLELELHRLDCLGSHGRLDICGFLRSEQQELERRPEIRPPLLTGDDLLEMGLKEGPRIGRWLGEIRERQLQGELKNAAEARAWLLEHGVFKETQK